MQTTNSNRRLLVLLVLVLIVKFGAVPLYDYQNSLIKEVQRDVVLKEKVQQVYSQFSDENKQKEVLASYQNSVKANFPVYQAASVRLDIQREVQAIFAEHKVSLDFFDIVKPDKTLADEFQALRVVVRFTGKAAQVAAVHAALDCCAQRQVDSMRLSPQETLSKYAEISGVMDISVYFVSKEFIDG